MSAHPHTCTTPVPEMRLSLRVLAHLLRYPQAQIYAHTGEMADALAAENALSAPLLHAVQALLKQAGTGDLLAMQAAYVELFDRGRATSLYLFEHVHGDSRARGPAMLDLLMMYQQGGLHLQGNELPDYLPVLLEFASTRPHAEARGLLAETAHILRNILTALEKRHSNYAPLLAALLELSGDDGLSAQAAQAGSQEKGGADDEEMSLDESWAEPEAFGPCPSQAQSGQPQAIHIVKNSALSAHGVLP